MTARVLCDVCKAVYLRNPNCEACQAIIRELGKALGHCVLDCISDDTRIQPDTPGDVTMSRPSLEGEEG